MPTTDLGPRLLAALGGAGNVREVENCITRLRVSVVDADRVDVPTLETTDGVLGVVAGPTTQIVLGPGLVDRTADQLEAALAGSASSADRLAAQGAAIKADRAARNDTPVKNALRRIANIFVPLIPALIACGIIAGLNGLITNLVASGDVTWLKGVPPLLAPLSSGFLSLIAVFVGINTAREFGGTPIIGGAVAGITVYAGVVDAHPFGQTLAPGQGGVIGALMAALLAVYLERWIRSWCPDALSMLVVPTLTVLITGLVALAVLMSLAGWISTEIAHGVTWLLAHGGPFTGLVLAGLFLPMVMLGLHQALTPIHATLIQQDGFTVLIPILAMAGAAQVGAAVAIYLRLKHNASIRKTIRSAVPAGLLGVGEPLIYGVTLPLGRPFVTACGGAAVSGAFMSTMNSIGVSVGSKAIGPSGWALYPLLDGNHGIGTSVLVYAIGEVIAYAAGFALTYFFGFSRDRLAELNRNDTGEGGLVEADDVPAQPGAREPAKV
ncbi:PTS alpha-glucoside transporter subunit IIA [Nocardioides mangrovicus]|uniref:PTS alpha-glucoside transporter subunit IIA n=1 Tax=Nocardioides mangrovicus TaxID=2478913 RepID=A0A3L8P0Q4_9ACTN|nr:PTS transporter subunit EIIC [Nocardioides mangrovicus]RLV49035.1 PTS alpha-glucoside transporter subunit IIA [Nocardioides mangrovicus]